MTGTGVVIACLTLNLNPLMKAQPGDVVRLVVILGLGYAFTGFLLGTLAGLGLILVSQMTGSKLSDKNQRNLESAMLGLLGFGPLFYITLLPDLGVAGTALTGFIFSPGPLSKIAVVLAAALVLGIAGWLLRPALSALRKRAGCPVGVCAAFGVVTVISCGIVWGWSGRPPSPPERSARAAPLLPTAPVFDTAPPLILLCVDGADLDDVILPMIEAGELPNFGKLINEGTWGELETFSPTLSPAVWTTLATGKSKEEHGIHGFTVYQLPGLHSSILEFPLHSGLNFKITPFLEKIPGMPMIRLPYSSDMRRVPALWNMVGEYYTVGVFGWRVTWPVELVNGFAVASAVTLGETELQPDPGRHPRLVLHPPGLYEGLLPTIPELPELDAVRSYLEPGVTVDPDDPRIRLIRSSMNHRPAHILTQLIQRHQPRFTAAAFYSVDAFNHYFGNAHNGGGPFAPAVAERYRFTDARLGDLLDGLDRDANLIVVSDHGYDFVNNNHTHGPPGVFLARGPAFSQGRRIEGLTVFDIAPMVLHLLGLPPGRDMPGAERGAYLDAFDPTFGSQHPVGTIPTWGMSASIALSPRVDGHERDILEELRRLGYIE